ncbi:MAG: hypothetical protein ABI035_05040, partial [Gemmatimonadaceae bacterium]
MIRSGRYELTLVATSGTRSGAKTTGRLWLTEASVTDRSPRTGEVAKIDSFKTPLYGATDLA